MRKVISFFLLFLVFISGVLYPANGNKYYFYSKTFTATASRVPASGNFTYNAGTFKASKICVYNKATTDSFWIDIDGNTAVADVADPTTNTTSIEIPPGVWCSSKDRLVVPIGFVSGVFAATKSGKVLIEAIE